MHFTATAGLLVLGWLGQARRHVDFASHEPLPPQTLQWAHRSYSTVSNHACIQRDSVRVPIPVRESVGRMKAIYRLYLFLYLRLADCFAASDKIFCHVSHRTVGRCGLHFNCIKDVVIETYSNLPQTRVVFYGSNRRASTALQVYAICAMWQIICYIMRQLLLPHRVRLSNYY